MIKAILIDDEAHCLETLSILLEEHCPEVQILDKCSSASEGLAAIGKLKPSLVFLDIQMTPMNGFQMLEQFPEIPFAMADKEFMEHGATTMPSVGKLPLAKGDPMSSTA